MQRNFYATEFIYPRVPANYFKFMYREFYVQISLFRFPRRIIVGATGCDGLKSEAGRKMKKREMGKRFGEKRKNNFKEKYAR